MELVETLYRALGFRLSENKTEKHTDDDTSIPVLGCNVTIDKNQNSITFTPSEKQRHKAWAMAQTLHKINNRMGYVKHKQAQILLGTMQAVTNTAANKYFFSTYRFLHELIVQGEDPGNPTHKEIAIHRARLYSPKNVNTTRARITQGLNNILQTLTDSEYLSTVITTASVNQKLYQVYTDATNPAIWITGGGVIFQKTQAISANKWVFDKGWIAIHYPELLPSFKTVATSEMLAVYMTLKNSNLKNCKVIIHVDNAEDVYLLIRGYDKKLSLAESIAKLIHELCKARHISCAVTYVNTKRNIADAATRAQKIHKIFEITGIHCEDVTKSFYSHELFCELTKRFRYTQSIHKPLSPSRTIGFEPQTLEMFLATNPDPFWTWFEKTFLSSPDKQPPTKKRRVNPDSYQIIPKPSFVLKQDITPCQ